MVEIRCAEKIKMVPIEDLKPNPENPNTHPDEQIEMLAKIIEYQGWRNPIIVSKRTGYMISGEGRLIAAKKLEMKKVPVSYQDYTDERQERADMLAQNAIDKKSIMDASKEKDILLELDTGEIDMDVTGYDYDDLEKKMTAYYVEEIEEDGFSIEDEYEKIENPQVKEGDLYQLGTHRLLCGDATNTEDVKRLTAGDLMDMVFTDPPYNVNYSSRGNLGNIKNDNMTDKQFVDFNLAWMENMKQALKAGGVFYICSGWQSFAVFGQVLKHLEMHLSNAIMWIKNAPTMGWDDYRRKHETMIKGKNQNKNKKAEPIIYGWRKGQHYFREIRDEADVWTVKRPASNKRIHPTQKPLKLVIRAIVNSSHRGDRILDLFAGGGSTLITAERTKRQAYLMELDPKFCDVQIKRWQEYTGKTAQLLGRKEGEGK